MTTSSFSVELATNLPESEREALLAALRAHADEVQEPLFRDIEWATIVVILEQAGKAAGGITAVMALAEKIYAWVQAARQHGVIPNVILKRPDQPALDLAQAGEQEILAWLLHNPPQQ